jgi:hypothetical protein
MDYRVSATDPQPPTRGVAWVGGISALALAVCPFLSWWMYDFGVSAPPDGSAARRLFYVYPGRSHAFGRLLVFFGLICVHVWVQYGRNTRRWMRPIAAALVVLLYLVCSIAVSALTAYIVLTRGGLPGMYADSLIGPGLYLALGASLTQSGCLIWLIYERLAWERMQKQRW